jgi:hypothetical protein
VINAVGRRRYSAARVMLLSEEVKSMGTRTSFIGGSMYELSDAASVICQLRGAARYLTMIHNGILFGGTFGFSELPTSRG